MPAPVALSSVVAPVAESRPRAARSVYGASVEATFSETSDVSPIDVPIFVAVAATRPPTGTAALNVATKLAAPLALVETVVAPRNVCASP